MIRQSIQLMRPRQWIKNVFVVAPLLFGHVPKDRVDSCLLILFAFAAYCCWSSAVYIINDWVDRDADRSHPRKCNRPIAAGAVTATVAGILSLGLIVLPMIAAVLTLLQGVAPERIFPFIAAGTAYLANGILYCLLFRCAIFLDVFSIATGFVLRVAGGCAIIGIEPSRWILICTFTLALFLAFGKRKMELGTRKNAPDYRPSLALYSAESLNIYLGISAAVCLVSYVMYTLDAGTVKLHHTEYLIFTVPFVLYGIFRYLHACDGSKYDGPDEFLLDDRPFQLNLILWAVSVAIILLTG